MKRMSMVVLLGLVALLGACGTSPGGGEVAPAGTLLERATPLALPSPTPTPFSFEGVGTVAEEPVDQEVVGESASSPQAEMVGAQHTVRAGETLLGIAMDYQVPMAAVQLQNGMGASTVVKVGEALEIPPAGAWSGTSPFWVVHEVSPGETLSEIAKAYDVEMSDLQAVNALPNGDALRAGQALVLPLDGPVAARAPEPTPAPPEPTPVPTVAVAAVAEPTAVASEPPTLQPTSSPPAVPPTDVADWPRELVRLINEVRAAEGLPPYTYNETLARAAQLHAEDCQQRGSCSHTGSDGSSVKERIVRAGYVGTGYAECWAQRPDPQGALDVWMDEVYPQADGTVVFGPHRKMMLHTWFTEIGVGIVESRWGYYFIADFGRP